MSTTIRKLAVLALILTGLTGCVCSVHAAAAPPLPPEAFIKQAQKPLLADAWCRLSGEVRYKGPGERITAAMSLALRLQPEQMQAEIVMDKTGIYGVEQVYAADKGLPEVRLQWPTTKPRFGLDKLGMQPEDLTFNFLFWQFAKELPGESMRGQECRLMVFRHPKTNETVQAWMSAEYCFPLRVQWFRKTETVPYRGLEFTDFKRQGELWFPVELHLSGENWVARITFGKADAALVKEQPAPANLFQAAAPVPAAPVAPKN